MTAPPDLLAAVARSVLDAVGDGVVVVDASRRVVWTNRSARELLGCSEREAAGESIDALLAFDGAERARGGAPLCREARCRARRARARVVEATHHAVVDDSGAVVAAVEILREAGSASRGAGPEARAAATRLVGASAPMRALAALVEQASATDAPVLITGEPGVGKRTAAVAIHERSGAGHFVCFDCSVRGDRDFEALLAELDADAPAGATLFLRRVDRLGGRGQARLRDRVAASADGASRRGRVMASTSGDIELAVERGAFDRELFYALNAVSLHVPPLRERCADVQRLVEHFVESYNERSARRRIEAVEPDALDVLTAYDYPENVRELEQILEHAFARCRGKRIRLTHLPERLLAHRAEPTGAEAADSESIELLERDFMLRVLEENGWRLADVALQLRLSRTTLWRKLKRLGIEKRRKA